MAKRILIAGGGHASLPIIKMGKHWKRKGYSVSLISSEPYLVYSGGLPQHMGGFYSFDEISINLKSLCENYGTEFICGTVTAVHSGQCRIETASGAGYDYDILLINVGVKTAVKHREENVYPVKPMSRLLPLLKKLKNGEAERLLIAGGGAAGIEIALNISHPNSAIQTELTLVEYQSAILPDFPKKAAHIALEALQKRGVRIKTGTSYDTQNAAEFDAVIDATGNYPASQSLVHDLKTGHDNRILTHASLLAQGTKNVFAAGDTADVDGKNYAPVGVHAVKQGPLLRKNINQLLKGQSLSSYKPYPVNPLILSNGNDDAIFTADGFCSRGKWASVLKFVLDINWLEKYKRPKKNRRNLPELFGAGYKRTNKS